MRAREDAVLVSAQLSVLNVQDREDDCASEGDTPSVRERALSRAYQELSQDVHRFAMHLTRNRALAADVTQETFVRAFRRLETLRVRERPLPWLLGIARNVVRESRHQAKRDGPPQDRDGHAANAETMSPPTPERVMLDRELVQVVDGALDTLATDRRAALVLRVDQGMSYAEIAEVMGWTLAKAKVEVHRARSTLREHVRRYQGGLR